MSVHIASAPYQPVDLSARTRNRRSTSLKIPAYSSLSRPSFRALATIIHRAAKGFAPENGGAEHHAKHIQKTPTWFAECIAGDRQVKSFSRKALG
jgi:hypothetical protein